MSEQSDHWVKPETKAPGALTRLQGNLEHLRAAIGRLSDRLSPVLRDEAPREDGDSPHPPSELYGLADTVLDYANRIDRLTERVDL